jgi:hypothetical protein
VPAKIKWAFLANIWLFVPAGHRIRKVSWPRGTTLKNRVANKMATLKGQNLNDTNSILDEITTMEVLYIAISPDRGRGLLVPQRAE